MRIEKDARELGAHAGRAGRSSGAENQRRESGSGESKAQRSAQLKDPAAP
jgi:hypothetical protein